ncbi:hypothetical protein RvY_09274 [Ramazzottius varieornatus]|uniref:Uncharacterized protein n=1 Tax=Ramazzottius varieornatus TaxID=947166 RepID=A0A1D1V8R1_RAMVA|nr:hypothetical protein RvY_09274 [Ramazzottius varieornatus]
MHKRMRCRRYKGRKTKYAAIEFEAPDQIVEPCHPRPKVAVAVREVPLKKMHDFTKKAGPDAWIHPDSQMKLNPATPVEKPRLNRRNNVLKNPRLGAGARDVTKLQPEIRRRARHFDGVKKKSNLEHIMAKDMTAGDSSCEEISPTKYVDANGNPINRKRKKKVKVEPRADPDVQILPVLPAIERNEERLNTSKGVPSQRNAAEHLNLIDKPDFANVSTPDLFLSVEAADIDAVPSASQLNGNSASDQQNVPPVASNDANIPAEGRLNEPVSIPDGVLVSSKDTNLQVQVTVARFEMVITMTTPMNHQKKNVAVIADDSPTYAATERVPNLSSEMKLEAMRFERLNL